MGLWHDFLHWLVPAATFKDSTTKGRDLALVRALIFLFYVSMLGFVIYTVWMLWEGRIEVIRSSIKLQKVETPSVAICPFMANSTIEPPGPGVDWVEGELIRPSGITKLNSTPYTCHNLKDLNRGCVCFDLGNYQLEDHTTKKALTSNPGFLTNDMETLFRERVEITTNLRDPSGEDTLEIGLYTHNDRLPDWFYVGQGQYTIGNLELATWTATDISVGGLQRTLEGDATAMAKYRLMFTFNGFQVGTRGLHRPWNQTKMSYEMKNFFVDETVSSEKAYSLYGCLILCLLFLVKSAIHKLFVDAVMPAVDPNLDKIVKREISTPVAWLAFVCCCCFSTTTDSADENAALSEETPLLKCTETF